MAVTLTARFDTRREAEMTIERLVQEQQIERTDIFVTTEGDDNSAGTDTAGSDGQAGAPSPEPRGDGAHNGRITVSVDVEDESKADAIRAAFAEFEADDVTSD